MYALLFRDTGLSVGDVSTLFILWSVTSFLLEVPSGAWADAVDRRMLLVLSALTTGAGFACWMLWPGYRGFALGFVLWGAGGALASGTFESLVYDGLAARRATDRYARLIGWAQSAAMTATLVGAVAAAPLLVRGGYPLVGWTSVGLAAVQAGLAATLPDTTRRARAGHVPVHDRAGGTTRSARRYLRLLRSGIAEAGSAAGVRHAVLLASAVVGVSAFDEFFPLVARDNGAATSTVPWLVGLVVLGQVVGTAAAGRTARVRGAVLGWMLLAAAVLISTGALLAPFVGFALIAVGYGLLNNAMVVSEARLQHAITGPARATVTSVAGLATELVALAVFCGFVLTGGWLSVPVQVAVLGVPMALVALLARRWLPAESCPGEQVRPPVRP